MSASTANKVLSARANTDTHDNVIMSRADCHAAGVSLVVALELFALIGLADTCCLLLAVTIKVVNASARMAVHHRCFCIISQKLIGNVFENFEARQLLAQPLCLVAESEFLVASVSSYWL